MGRVTAPLVRDFGRDSLLAVAKAERQPWDLSEVVLHEGGWENVVLETADGWMLRFPRDDEVAFEREVAVLRRLAGRLPVPIPEVAWTGATARFAAYRKLSGHAFDRESYLSASTSERNAFAASLARFLVAMHSSLSSAEVAELGLPPAGQPGVDLVRDRIEAVPREHRGMVLDLTAEFEHFWIAGNVTGSAVVLHNDFHTLNMVFAGPVGELTGIWDFSCVELGLPTFDLRYFDGGPRDLLERLAAQYEELSGNAIDLRAAVVANRMENVYDALDTHRTDLFHAALERWGLADAGG